MSAFYAKARGERLTVYIYSYFLKYPDISHFFIFIKYINVLKGRGVKRPFFNQNIIKGERSKYLSKKIRGYLYFRPLL